jgi:putative membrane protein
MIYLKRTALFAAFIATTIISITACNSDEKLADTKKVAEEANEVKFDNTNTEKDAKFLVNAAEINLEEIKLGQLAQQKGIIADVKELGRMMEEAHTKAMAETDTLAKKMLITIPASPTENALEAYKKLNNKSGTAFDKAYCDMMVNGHKDAISLFEKASTDLNNAGIKQWAAGILPGLRSHLDHAIQCKKKCETMK